MCVFGAESFLYFAGCDYFRLASHPAVLRALESGARRYGLNVAASRLTTGNHRLYRELEKKLSAFFRAPAALVTSNGYAANAVVAQAFQDDCALAAIDDRAHSSLRDASRLLRCPVHFFKHRNPDDLARVVKHARPSGKTILLTDGMFAYDGEIAPLARYFDVLPGDAMILLDDAHGAGLLGSTGKGTPELAGVRRDRIIQTISLSKAFGVFGGAILGPTAIREKILAGSPMFAGSTPLPLPIAAGAIQAIKILKTHPSLRARLGENVRYVKSALRAGGFAVVDTPSPIISLAPSDPREAAAIRKRLISHGIFPSFIKYPGGPPEGYLRLVVCSEHTRAQLDALSKALLGA